MPWLHTVSLPSVPGLSESWLSLLCEMPSKWKCTRTVLSVWNAPEHLVEHPVAFDLLPLHAEGGEAVPVDVLRAVLVLRVLFGLPGGLLRRTLRLLLLPGLGLLLRLHGRLHLVLRNERLARLDGLALPLPEIGGYPLHLLFRHTEEVEAGRIFQLVPEVGKEIRKHIAVAIHPQEVVVVLQRVLGL